MEIYVQTSKLDKILNEYATSLNLNINNSKLSEAIGKMLFQKIITDYINGKISVDDLSLLCEKMYAKFDVNTTMYSLLLYGAEIEWYIRHEPLSAACAIEDLIKNFSI